MNLVKPVCESCVRVGVHAGSKSEVLRLVAKTAKANHCLDNITEDLLVAALEKRETITTTGIGDGIAIPHCSFDGIDEFVVGILTIPHGVDFDAVDGKKVSLIMFIISPKGKQHEHIRLLSGISRILHEPHVASSMIKAKSPMELLNIFHEYTPIAKNIQSKNQYCLFHVIVQKEDIFNDLLTIFSELEDGYVTVVEGNNASVYLQSMPLFASFWTESKSRFNRVVLAAVRTNCCNEVIRRINLIINNLPGKTGVMLTVQPLFYFDGALEY